MSRQRTWKDIDAGWTPKLESCRCSQNAIGFDVSIIAKDGGMTSTATEQTARWFEVMYLQTRRGQINSTATPSTINLLTLTIDVYFLVL